MQLFRRQTLVGKYKKPKHNSKQPHTMRQSVRIDIRPVIVAVVVVVAAVVMISADAAELPECDSVAANSFINNTRSNCSHSLIYCDGDNSQFCDSTVLCDLEYTCPPATNGSTTLLPLPADEEPAPTTSSDSSTDSTVSTPATLDVRALCRRGVTKKYMYPGNCNYYYYCVDGFLIVEQCPIGYAYNELAGTCSGRIQDVAACRQP